MKKKLKIFLKFNVLNIIIPPFRSRDGRYKSTKIFTYINNTLSSFGFLLSCFIICIFINFCTHSNDFEKIISLKNFSPMNKTFIIRIISINPFIYIKNTMKEIKRNKNKEMYYFLIEVL